MNKASEELLNTKWLITAIIFTGVVLFRTYLPDDRRLLQLKMQVSGFDKVEHALAYGAITLLFILSLRTFSSSLSAGLLLLGILAVGAVDELTQPFAGRTTSLIDWVADMIGITAVLLFCVVFKRRPPTKPKLLFRHS